MASKEEKDKEREERLLNRNKMKEQEEKAKLIQEGKKKIQEGRQLFLIDREGRKDEMRRMVHSHLDDLGVTETRETEKTRPCTQNPDQAIMENREASSKQAELLRSASLVDSKWSSIPVLEVQAGALEKKSSLSLGSSPREMVLGNTFKDDKRIPPSTCEILIDQGVEDQGVDVSTLASGISKAEKSKQFLATVDADIAELDVWLAKFPTEDSKKSSEPVRASGIQDLGSKEPSVKECTVQSLRRDQKDEKKKESTVSTELPLQWKDEQHRKLTEIKRKSLSSRRSSDEECSSRVALTEGDKLSKSNLKDIPLGAETEKKLVTSSKETAQMQVYQKDNTLQTDSTGRSREDTKEVFDYDQFLRDLADQGFENVASTVKKAPKEDEKAQKAVNLKGYNSDKYRDSAEKEYTSSVNLPNLNKYLVRQEQIKKDELDAREKEVAEQELDLQWRRESERRLNTLREESELTLVNRMKEDRLKREAAIKAKEDALNVKKQEFERYEYEQKAERRSGKFLSSTLIAIRKEQNLKESLQTREHELENEETEFYKYKQRKDKEEQLRRDSELAELEKLKDERRRKEEGLSLRLAELKKRKLALEQKEYSQTESLHSVLIREEEKLIEAINSREVEITQHEIALMRRQGGQDRSVEDQKRTDEEHLLELKHERELREAALLLREREIANKKAELDRLEQERRDKKEKERSCLIEYLEKQQNRQSILDAFENALIQKEKQLGKIANTASAEESMECRLLQEIKEKKDSELREREDKLIRKQEELDKYEKSILLQEEQQRRKQSSLQIEQLLAKRETEYEKKLLEIKQKEDQLLKREQSLKERESSLLLSTNSSQRSYEELKSQICETPSQSHVKTSEVLPAVKESEAKEDSTACGNTAQAVASIPLISENQFPKFSIFSGEDQAPKHEVAFEEWKFEVNRARRNGIYSEHAIAQSIFKSLRPPAKKVLFTMDQSATVDEIVKGLEGVFGSVSSGIRAMQDFFTAAQKPDESAVNWGLRLEGIIQKAIDKGYIKKEEKNDLLKEQFWRSLKSEKLKNATRVHYNTISSFELLRREVRTEEEEMYKSTGAQHQPIKVGNDSTETKETDSKLDTVLQRLNSLEKMMKYGKGGGGNKWTPDGQDNRKENDEKNKKTEAGDKKPLN